MQTIKLTCDEAKRLKQWATIVLRLHGDDWSDTVDEMLAEKIDLLKAVWE